MYSGYIVGWTSEKWRFHFRKGEKIISSPKPLIIPRAHTAFEAISTGEPFSEQNKRIVRLTAYHRLLTRSRITVTVPPTSLLPHMHPRRAQERFILHDYMILKAKWL